MYFLTNYYIYIYIPNIWILYFIYMHLNIPRFILFVVLIIYISFKTQRIPHNVNKIYLF